MIRFLTAALCAAMLTMTPAQASVKHKLIVMVKAPLRVLLYGSISTVVGMAAGIGGACFVTWVDWDEDK